MKAATHFLTGPDAADLIARAATEACLADRNAYLKGLSQEGGDIRVVDSMVEQLDVQLIRKLKLYILERRALKQ